MRALWRAVVQTRRAGSLSAILGVLFALAVVSAPAAAAAGAVLRIDTVTTTVNTGESFVVTVTQDAPVLTSGAQATISFDPAILQVVSVSFGPAYAGAEVFLPRDLTAAIRLANQSGSLAQIAAAFTPPSAVPAGPASFLVIKFWAKGCGRSEISLPTGGPRNAQMISGASDTYGREVPVTTTGGHVTSMCTGQSAGTTASMPPIEVGTTPAGTTSANATPVGLIGAAGTAGILGVGLFGAFAWRSRRRAPAEDEAW
jgi:hypothetical protein